MTDIVLVLNRGAEQQAAFDEFVASQYDSSSPNFHHWLQPAEIGERFGPSLTDIATVSNWLASHGLSVAAVSKDRMSIRFGGTAAQVQSTFHTEIHNLAVNGARHIANMSDPQIPAALAPVVVGIKGLHNFLPHPLHRMGSKVQFSPDAHGWVKVQNSPGTSLAAGGFNAQSSGASARPALSAKPDFYYPFSGSTAVEEDVAPYDFATIYNLLPLWNASTPITGSGQMIAIVGTSDINLTDVANFKSAFGLPAGNTPVIAHGPDGDPGVCTGGANACNGGDLDENSLDVEWSGAVAPGAQIVLVTDAYDSQTSPTNDPVFDGSQWVVENATVQGTAVYGARIMSLSYGLCELFNGTATNVAFNNLWQTAASSGIAVFAATGDSGAPSCDQGGDGSGVPYEAQYGLAVSGLASTPYNTAVGGTDFSWCQPSYSVSGNKATFQGCTSTNAATDWNTTNSTQQSSAKGYVPETPWNDTCLNPIWAAYFQSIAPLFKYTAPANAEAACNFIYSDWSAVNQDNVNGGGIQFVIAPWLDTVGGSGGASGCVVNSTGSTAIGSCNAGDTSTGSTYGNVPLVNDGWPKPSWQTNAGLPADGVRDLPDVSFFAGDGTLDSATLICVSNDGASCTNISATAGGGTGEAEEVGGTSVATPEMAGVMALINQKAGAPQGSPNAELYKLAAAQTYSSCSAEAVSTSSACYFNDVDQGTNAMACDYEGKATEGGTSYDPSSGLWEPTAAAAGLASPNCSIVNSGDVVGTLSGYSAVAGFDQATGLGSLNIANVVNAWTATTGTGAATVTVTPAQTTIAVNQALSVTVTLSVASGTPTGTVTLVGPGYAGGAQAVAASPYAFTFNIPANGLSGGTDTLTGSYSGDSNFAEAQGSATVTVTKLTPTGITVTPASSSIGEGGPLTVTGAVSGLGPTPTGTVTLSGGGYTSAATSLSGGNYSITIPGGALNVGSDTLTVSYSGDLNYAAVSGTATVTVTASGYSMTASAPAAVSSGASASSTITVSTTSNYAGIVSLTCALASSPAGASTTDLPSCTPNPGNLTVTLSATASSGQAVMSVTTTAATAALRRPALRRDGKGLASAGGAVLALLVLLGIPAQRRKWRTMLGALVLLAALGSLAACGGGGGGSGGGGGASNPGTTAGTYTFTVTGTGNPPMVPVPTTTFTLTVN